MVNVAQSDVRWHWECQKHAIVRRKLVNVLIQTWSHLATFLLDTPIVCVTFNEDWWLARFEIKIKAVILGVNITQLNIKLTHLLLYQHHVIKSPTKSRLWCHTRLGADNLHSHQFKHLMYGLYCVMIYHHTAAMWWQWIFIKFGNTCSILNNIHSENHLTVITTSLMYNRWYTATKILFS